MNTRALKLKSNSEEYDSKLADIKRLKNTLEAFLRRRYFERCQPFALRRVVCQSRNLVLRAAAGTNVRDGVRIELHRGGILIEKDSDMDLEIVRVVHDNMDVMLELVEELFKEIGQPDCLKYFLRRFDVE